MRPRLSHLLTPFPSSSISSLFGALLALSALLMLAPSASAQTTTGRGWGFNGNWQLGDGSNISRTAPVQVQNLTGIVAVAGGYYHSLALKSDGTVWAWGRNDFGALGDGTLIDRTTPVHVRDLSGVVAISVGEAFSLALKSDGSVWAWGSNHVGQLGDGTTSQRNTAVRVSGLTGVKAIGASHAHGLAVLSDGTVRAWGSNTNGELGNGTTTQSSTPVQVSGLTDVKEVSAGFNHSLALKTDGTVWAWGRNEFGQLGDGTNAHKSTPVQVPGISTAAALSKSTPGGHHTLVLLSDGQVAAWGNNHFGGLGDGTNVDRNRPALIDGLAGVRQLANGGYHSLALMSDGTVRAWGDNGFGRLGDGTTTHRSRPVQVSGLSGINAVGAGGEHSLAIHVLSTPTFSLLSSPTIEYGTPSTTLSGRITGGPTNPTGSVSISLSGVTRQAAIQPDGTFSFSFNTGALDVSASPHPISYSYAGDSNHTAASDDTRSLTVVKAAQSITFDTPADKTFGDQDFPVGASATSGLGVSFSASGACTVSGTSVRLTGAGSCTITASQAGNSNYHAAPSVQRTFQVAKADTVTAVSSSANPSASGQNVTFTAVVVSPAGAPSGSVQFKAGGANLGSPVALNAGGTATLSTSALPAGSHSITAEYGGSANFNPSSGTLSARQVVGDVIEFTQSLYTAAENAGPVLVTIRRVGDTSQAATVEYATDDGSTASVAVPCSATTGLALDRCDYTRAAGSVSFAAGEASKTFTVLVGDDSYVEGAETMRLRLSNPSGGAVVGHLSTATFEITDDAQETSANPNDDSEKFVRQHYHDFFSREPDAPGLAHWTNVIESCGSDQQCREVRRINVSGAFFLSIEFQQTGYLVERLYKSAYGDATGTSTLGGTPHTLQVPIVRLEELLPDTQRIGRGVVVHQGEWQAQLEANKRAFVLEFVQRARFTSAFPSSLTPTEFVDRLNGRAGGPLDASERQALIDELTANNTTAGRAGVLRKVAEDPTLEEAEKNRAFVLMQYFGYLRRNPNEGPDTDYTGYDFWLGNLNRFNGNFVQAELVKAFITSIEYRQRFGQ